MRAVGLRDAWIELKINLGLFRNNCKKEKGWVCPQKNITKATSDRSSDDGGSRDDDFLAVSNDKDDDESSTNRKQYIQKVTIRHILGMSSGLQSYDYIADHKGGEWHPTKELDT